MYLWWKGQVWLLVHRPKGAEGLGVVVWWRFPLRVGGTVVRSGGTVQRGGGGMGMGMEKVPGEHHHMSHCGVLRLPIRTREASRARHWRSHGPWAT